MLKYLRKYGGRAMKFPFLKRKQTKPPREEPKQALFTVLLSRADEETLALLPDGCEVLLPPHVEPPAERFPALSFRTDGKPSGKYVLSAGETSLRPVETAELFSELAERSEDAVLFYAERPENGKAAESAEILFAKEKNFDPRVYGCALRAPLYRRARELAADLAAADAEVLAPLLLAETAVFLPLQAMERRTDKDGAPKSDEGEELCAERQALVCFFNEVKTSLTAIKYRFAFNYVCERVIGAFALLAAAGETEKMQEFDAFLKKENMALRVAAGERAPMKFVSALRKNGYRAPLWHKPVIAVAAAKERARRNR